MSTVDRRHEDPEQRRPRRATSACSARSRSGSRTSSTWWKEMGPAGFQAGRRLPAHRGQRRRRRLGALRLREDARLPLGHLPRRRRAGPHASASATTWASPSGRRSRASTATRCAASSSPRATPSRRASSSSACSATPRPIALRPAQPLPGERRGGPPPLGDGLPAAQLLRPRRPRGGRGAARAPPRQPRQAAHPRRLQRAVHRLARRSSCSRCSPTATASTSSLALAESGFDPLVAHDALHADRGGAPHVRRRDRRGARRRAHRAS